MHVKQVKSYRRYKYNIINIFTHTRKSKYRSSISLVLKNYNTIFLIKYYIPEISKYLIENLKRLVPL